MAYAFALFPSIPDSLLKRSPFLTKELITLLVFDRSLPIILGMSVILAGVGFLSLISRTIQLLEGAM